MHTVEVIASSAEMPLHQQTAGQLQSAWVSSTSRWGDERWVLDNPTPGAQPISGTVNWAIVLADGTRLTDPKHAAMLDWLRRFAWSLFSAPPPGRRPSSPGSAISLGLGIASLARWMAVHSIVMPDQLDSHLLEEYLADLPEILAGEVSESDSGDRSAISYNRAYCRLHTPILLWEARHTLAKAGIAPMPSIPWGGRSAKRIAEEIANQAQGWIPPLPDEVAIPLLNRAAWFLDVPARDVLLLHAQCVAAFDRAPCAHPGGDGSTYAARRYRRRRAAGAFAFSTPPGESKPWHPPLRAAPLAVRGHVRRGEITVIMAMQQVRRLVLAVRDAAAIVLLGSTGMRISELCGLPAGTDASTGLPRGVWMEKSPTGLNELFFVRSVLAKTETVPRDVDWLLGMRAVGDPELPLPVCAIQIVNELLQRYRDLIGSDRLFISFTSPIGLPDNAAGAGPIQAGSLNRNVRDFIEAWVDLTDLPDQSAHPLEERDLVRYRESKGRCVSSHQFRKTYAQFVYAVDSRLLPVLQMQFHHVSQAMTEAGYIGRNVQLIEPFDSVQRQQTALMMFEAATGQRMLSARMGKFLYETLVPALAEQVRSLTVSAGWKVALRFCEEYDLRAYTSPHGKCMPLFPHDMACHQAASTVTWFKQAPNFTTRSPSLCSGCRNMVFDAQHRGFWEKRYVENAVHLRRAEMAGADAAFAVIRERARVARALLVGIGADTAALDRQIDKEVEHGT